MKDRLNPRDKLRKSFYVYLSLAVLGLLSLSTSCSSVEQNNPCDFVKTGTFLSLSPQDLEAYVINKAYSGHISDICDCPTDTAFKDENGDEQHYPSYRLIDGKRGPIIKTFSVIRVSTVK